MTKNNDNKRTNDRRGPLEQKKPTCTWGTTCQLQIIYKQSSDSRIIL